MSRPQLVIIALLSLVSCTSPTSDASIERQAVDGRSDIASYCGRTPVRFSEKLNISSPQDAAIAKKFVATCQELSRQDGLDFGEGLSAYECRVHYPRMSSDFVTEKFEHAGWWDGADPQYAATYIAQLRKAESDFKRIFGMPLSLELFDPAAQDAEDLMERTYNEEKEKKSFDSLSQKKGIPIAHLAAEDGVTATIIILSDTNSAKERFLISHEELSNNLKGVRSLAGAASLLYFQNLTGMAAQNSNEDRYESDFGSPICRASSIASAPSGWTIKGMEIHRNCRSPINLNVRVSRSGAITIEKSDEAGLTEACFD